MPWQGGRRLTPQGARERGGRLRAVPARPAGRVSAPERGILGCSCWGQCGEWPRMDRPLRPGPTPREGLRARGQRGRREAGAWHLGPEGVTGEPFRTHCGRGVAPQAAVGTAKEGRAVGAGHRAGRSPLLGGCVCQRILNNTLVSSPPRLRGLRVSHLRPTVTAPRLMAPESLPVTVLRDHWPVMCPLTVTRHQTPPRAPPHPGLPCTPGSPAPWAPPHRGPRLGAGQTPRVAAAAT